MHFPHSPLPPSPRGQPQSQVSVGQPRLSSASSCKSAQTSSSTEEYCKKVAHEAAMDIDVPPHSPSWAEQMDLKDAIPPIDQIDFNDALPTQEQLELEYAQSALPPHSQTRGQHASSSPSS